MSVAASTAEASHLFRTRRRRRPPALSNSLRVVDFPSTAEELKTVQRHLGAEDPLPFESPQQPLRVAGVFVCFGRGGSGPGAAGATGWAGTTVLAGDRCLDAATVTGSAGGPYQPGLLALREGALLAAAVERLREPFDVLLVNATGRDHPRRAGVALHLGAYLQVPTVGVTHRPLLAWGPWPSKPERGARAPLTLDGEVVGYWVRTRAHCRPLAIHAAWRTDPDIATRLALEEAVKARTPEPLRQARQLAREARTHSNR